MKQCNLGQLFLIMVLFAVLSQEVVIVRKSLQINEDEVFAKRQGESLRTWSME